MGHSFSVYISESDWDRFLCRRKGSSSNHVIQTVMGSGLLDRVVGILLNSRGGSLWNSVGFGLILSHQNDPSGCPLAQPSTSHTVGLQDTQTCTVGRHLGSE